MMIDKRNKYIKYRNNLGDYTVGGCVNSERYYDCRNGNYKSIRLFNLIKILIKK